jgi:hypothetical protein
MPGIFVHDHLNENVAREKLTVRGLLLPTHKFDHRFLWNTNFSKEVLHVEHADPLFKGLANLCFKS